MKPRTNPNKFVFYLTLIFLISSCNPTIDSTSGYSPDFSSNEGIKNHISHKTWSIWGGSLTFTKNNSCNFTRLDKRSGQQEWNINGKYVVGRSRFKDSGDEFLYVSIDWDTKGIINDFYTIYTDHLVEQSGEWIRFDNHGPLLDAWRSEGGLVNDQYKAY